jgi:hypothetical protein
MTRGVGAVLCYVVLTQEPVWEPGLGTGPKKFQSEHFKVNTWTDCHTSHKHVNLRPKCSLAITLMSLGVTG